jgi:hypothetical protein
MGHILRRYAQPVASSRGRPSSSSSSSSPSASLDPVAVDQHLTTLVEILSKQPLRLVDRLLEWLRPKSLEGIFLHASPSMWNNIIVPSPYYHQLLTIAETALTAHINEIDDGKNSWSIIVKDDAPVAPHRHLSINHRCECKECRAVHRFLLSSSQREYKVGGTSGQRTHVRGTYEVEQSRHLGLITVSPVKGQTTLVITKTEYVLSASLCLYGTCSLSLINTWLDCRKVKRDRKTQHAVDGLHLMELKKLLADVEELDTAVDKDDNNKESKGKKKTASSKASRSKTSKGSKSSSSSSDTATTTKLQTSSTSRRKRAAPSSSTAASGAGADDDNDNDTNKRRRTTRRGGRGTTTTTRKSKTSSNGPIDLVSDDSD